MRAPLPDAPVSGGYGFFALQALNYPADEMTEGVAHYLLRTQRAAGNWADYNIRPPMEDDEVVATAWATLALRDYTPRGLEAEHTNAQRRAVKWLAAQQPVSHNEAVFVLLGLYWSGEPASRVGFAAARLVKTQRADGGWSQLPTLQSDAWATGTALYGLHEAGGMAATDPVYQRGVAFLLRTQFEDGSWWVRSRTWAFPPHFNGQFPHGKDQWISQGASGWAALALLATLEPAKNGTPRAADQHFIEP